ncbi:MULTISPECIES: hypothetical protein [unclassified Streptomyces]|uniref:hypothetical protein n=1 Tax=unclassified Streptomyces TaxID=2593676 RepID=UPI0004C1C8A6|nr:MULTISPECIES: hypothetical protein [unclassified Streptomyces]KOV90519.1 hypothetical protein ADL04_36335 [Streptomyces sp. NRRL B-3648]
MIFQLPLAAQLPVLLAALVFLAVYAGVVLPAVWSRRPARRTAALRVLDRLLGALRRWRRG